MARLEAKQILELIPQALENEEFVVYFQPQYNHSNGMLIGSEALVRWISPTHGFISPAEFIPVLEANNLIPQLDLFVFEHVCKFLRYSIDENLAIARISVNISRCDIATPDFIDRLEIIREKYDVPTKYIHVEITESAAVEGVQVVIDAFKRFHSLGYVIEMDDFGSGYSSLNVLKDIEFDVLKLDLKFIAGTIGNSRGGTILSSVVRMAKWLKLPVIAEGVETLEQADFLRSVGCDYIQGYLYSKPIPCEEYKTLLRDSSIGSIVPQMPHAQVTEAGRFWNPDSLETMIFSNLAGPAAIFDYHGEYVELLRVNQRYLKEFGSKYTEKDVLSSNILEKLEEDSKDAFLETLHQVIKTRDERECEVWVNIPSEKCGIDKMCIHSTVRMIGESKVSRLFYVMIRDVTAEKLIGELARRLPNNKL